MWRYDPQGQKTRNIKQLKLNNSNDGHERNRPNVGDYTWFQPPTGERVVQQLAMVIGKGVQSNGWKIITREHSQANLNIPRICHLGKML
jgi:hypothetical protein